MVLYKEVSQPTSCNIMRVCDYDGTYEQFDVRFRDYPGNVVNVPLSAETSHYLFGMQPRYSSDRSWAALTGTGF